ncbi:MAG: hypothetical protein WKF30_11030, partial [Pyrinomonadaceae bacterium]
MKTLAKILGCAAMLVSLSSFASAQLAYTVSDKNGASPQELFRFDINVCAAENLGFINTATEQEGLFSSGAVLFGYSENDAALGTAEEQNPGTRILPPVPNAPLGPNPNRAVCSFPGAAFGTESGAAYNPSDGYVYVVNSDDTIPAGQTRSRFSRFKPGCQDFSVIGTSQLYIDGLAINNQNQGFASDPRLTDRLYRFTPGPTLSLVQTSATYGLATNEDSGLAWDFENDRLVLLLELGRVFFVNPTTGAATLSCTLPIATIGNDLEGL